MSFADLVAGIDRATRNLLGGVSVSYQPAFGIAVTVQGMFDAQYLLVANGEAGVEQRGPAVFLRLEDLPTDPEEDEDPWVTINGISYQVTARKPDGQGGIVLLLHLVE